MTRVDQFEELCLDEARYDVPGSYISEQKSHSVVDCCQNCREGCHGVLYNRSSQKCYMLGEPTSCPPADTMYLRRKQHAEGKVNLL